MSDIFGKIFGKDKHQSQQSKEKEKCTSPSADKSAASLTPSTSAKTSDFCMYQSTTYYCVPVRLLNGLFCLRDYLRFTFWNKSLCPGWASLSGCLSVAYIGLPLCHFRPKNWHRNCQKSTTYKS